MLSLDGKPIRFDKTRRTCVRIDVPNFSTPGRTSRFVWNEGAQHLELAEVGAGLFDNFRKNWILRLNHRGFR